MHNTGDAREQTTEPQRDHVNNWEPKQPLGRSVMYRTYHPRTKRTCERWSKFLIRIGQDVFVRASGLMSLYIYIHTHTQIHVLHIHVLHMYTTDVCTYIYIYRYR